MNSIMNKLQNSVFLWSNTIVGVMVRRRFEDPHPWEWKGAVLCSAQGDSINIVSAACLNKFTLCYIKSPHSTLNSENHQDSKSQMKTHLWCSEWSTNNSFLAKFKELFGTYVLLYSILPCIPTVQRTELEMGQKYQAWLIRSDGNRFLLIYLFIFTN